MTAARPARITVVCSGNICRSPMAEVILRQLLAETGRGDVIVTSGGLGGWHVGDGADPRAVRMLRDHGYDGAAHRARQFRQDWFADHDLVLAADRGHLRALQAMARTEADLGKVRLLRSFDPRSAATGQDEVEDPYYGSRADFEQCLLDVEAACRGVVAYVTGNGDTADRVEGSGG
ncbi:MAG: low molecular weight protein-tyrosine-phosphatase [Dermatophilaceae bacterium]